MASDFDALIAIERELVLRLASLLWRLRRATAIDTGLLQLQSEMIGELARPQDPAARVNRRGHHFYFREGMRIVAFRLARTLEPVPDEEI